MTIPSILISEISAGNAVLFLGAGASMISTDDQGNRPPNGKKLGEMLSKAFLGGKFCDYPLNQISEYAISESNLFTVQEFIRNTFLNFGSTPAHEKMATFSWRGIATTNYDLVVEKSYEKVTKKSKRILVPFVENGDRVDDKLRNPNALPYLKLHGCINRVSSKECPLILTIDQYSSYKSGRSRIFDHLKNWGYESPLIFAGYALSDPNIRQIISELDETGSRPRYYLVAPEVSDVESRFWESKKITTLKCTFEQFIDQIDKEITSPFRAVANLIVTTSLPPISKKFTHTKKSLSENCSLFLENDVEFVEAIKTTNHISPKLFYKGFNTSWSAIEQNLDAPRKIADTILSEHVVIDRKGKESFEFILLRGHAGSGKSVILRRLAWDAAKSFGRVCLYVNPHGILNSAALNELIEACNQSIFLFIDDISNHAKEIGKVVAALGSNANKLKIIAGVRTNEWNAYSAKVDNYVTAEFDLGFLTQPEISKLVDLLSQHKALGKLENSPKKECEQAFIEIAGRQLLVALYEATNGRPFEDIIADEYKKITPHLAQQIYLSICILNRLGVPVRAGIISRIYDVNFTEFKEKIFSSLEEVITFSYDPIARDHVFQSRHQYIAEIVFNEILKDTQLRFDEFLKCFNQLNLDYGSDSKAFQKMTHGRTLLDMFPDHQMVKEIFEIAKRKNPEDPHLLHQMALYELNRPDGNLATAEELLSSALDLAPWSNFVAHSLAELYLKRADGARSKLEGLKYIEEVEKRCSSLLESSDDSYGVHTLTKAKIKRLSLLMNSTEEPSNAELQSCLRDIESCLDKGLKQYPNDAHLLSAEAELAKLISDSKRAIHALEKAFRGNSRNTYAAIQLGRYYQGEGRLNDCIGILKQAVTAAPMQKELHLALGRALMLNGATNYEEQIYHFRRSYTPGDKSYDAQLLHARSLYLNGAYPESKEIFRSLAYARVPHSIKIKQYYPVHGDNTGTIQKIEATFLFIVQDGTGEWAYCHRSNISDSIWNVISVGTRVTFSLSFSFKGASAADIKLAE